MKKKIIIVFIVFSMLLTEIPLESASAAEKPASGSCMISAGCSQLGAVTPDGTFIMVGSNESGLIGCGVTGDYSDATDLLVLKPIAVMKDVEQISVQNYTTFALKKDHTLWSWGFDHQEALGNGSGIWNSAVPTKILEDVKFIATGHGLHMLAIKEDNTLWGWGFNKYGQLTDKVKGENAVSPVKLMDHVVYASAGNYNSAVIKEDGSLWTWGYNVYGECGTGNTTEYHKPVKIMDDVKTVSMGFHRSCALKKDGTVWVWGSGNNGEIGNGTYSGSKKPVKVLSDVVSITTKAEGHILALKKDGTVWAWGDNACGQLGDGTTVSRSKPVKVLSGVKMVDSNYAYSAALKKDNTLWAWGDNSCGQLGLGDTKQRLEPTKVLDLDTALTDGTCTTPAITLDGLLDDWDNPDPIYTDALKDSLKKETDLESVNAYMDSKYIYLAVKVKGMMANINIEFFPLGTKGTKYSLSYSADRNLMNVYKDDTDIGKDLCSCNVYDNTVEIRVPLSLIGNPKKTSIWTVLEYDGVYMCDQSREWTAVPIKKAGKYTTEQKKPEGPSGILIDGFINDWGDIEPVAIDPIGDYQYNSADIESLYSFTDEKYFYFALKCNKAEPDFIFDLDCNKDDKPEYSLIYDPFYKSVMVKERLNNGTEKDIDRIYDFSVNELFEMKIPLDLLGIPEDIRIKGICKSNHFDGDEIEEWCQVPSSAQSHNTAGE